MMRTVLDTADAPAHASFVERKSEFIGDAAHAATPEEALAFVGTIRDAHPKARHVAYAAVCGDGGRLKERMSDDGEPSGTAGKPILDVLRANGLTDTVVTVTRYFGGILLGSGGLTRAYSTGASSAVRAARLAGLVLCRRMTVTLAYPQLDRFLRLLEDSGGTPSEERYTDRVSLTASVPDDRADAFLVTVRETFGGTVRPEPLDTVPVPVPEADERTGR